MGPESSVLPLRHTGSTIPFSRHKRETPFSQNLLQFMRVQFYKPVPGNVDLHAVPAKLVAELPNTVHNMELTATQTR